MHDVAIVGGGPAGLSAALVLGRCRRNVILFDKGEQRNARSKALHGFLTRDGIPPRKFLSLARAELQNYPSVRFVPQEVLSAKKTRDGFVLKAADGSTVRSRIILLATGVVDKLPGIPNLKRFYARSVHHCPYCDGWEHRDEKIAVLGSGDAGAELALELRQWSKRITLCLDNGEPPSAEMIPRLEKAGVRLRSERIVTLEGEGDQLQRIVFSSGPVLECSALFFSPQQEQRSGLARSLGCEFTGDGFVACGESQMTRSNGVFAVGNATPGRQLVIIAAAEGTQAALSINEWLSERETAAGR